MRPSQNSHMGLELAAGFLPWLISKVAPPLLPPQALSNRPNPSDKYSRRKAEGLAGDRQRELALGQLCDGCNRVTCMCLKQDLSVKLRCPGIFGEALGFGGEVGSWVFFSADGVTSQLDWNGLFLVLR